MSLLICGGILLVVAVDGVGVGVRIYGECLAENESPNPSLTRAAEEVPRLVQPQE